ncbi:SMI1/KNR4 family protein [Streptomyces sp. NPDC003737]|uniref:SMI1/KNR4 family protein n=1 Tax=Streptomyces sp. NPDC003737 TaxID=3364685 RepID=UPI00367B329A
MEFKDFSAILERVRATRSGNIPSDIQLLDSWLASDSEIRHAEDELGVRLPEKYKEFMQRIGGGQFIFIDLLPVVSPEGRHEDVVEVNQREPWANDFVAVSPVGTGDWWGFNAVGGICGDEVFIRIFEDGSREVEASDFLEFAARQGLRAG